MRSCGQLCWLDWRVCSRTRRIDRAFGLDVNEALPNQGRDLLRCSRGFIVFPDPDDEPSFLRQSRVGVSVAFLVRDDLGSPPCSIVDRDCAMLGAPMPDAAVYKDGYLGTAKHNISAPTEPRQRGSVDRIAQAKSMKSSSQRELTRRVTLRLRLEPPANGFILRNGCSEGSLGVIGHYTIFARCRGM